MTFTDGITLLGSEMLTWSDLDGEAGGFGGLLAPHLLHGFAGARDRVLIAGPTTAAVVLDVAGQFATADVLVRSWLDAQQLRAALPAEVGVFCGPLDRMVRTGKSYDAVVAVAGTDRLHSAEDSTPSVDAVLADLVSLVGDAGELYVGIGNPVGIDRLLSLDSSSRHHDAAWPDGLAMHGPAPTVAAVLERLGAHGLTQVETWYCHGRRSAPLVAASSAVLLGASEESVLLRALAHAYDVGDASTPALKDLASTARDLARSGLAAPTAPLAVAHLRRGTAAESGDPAILIAEHADQPAAAAYRLTRPAAGWTRELLEPQADVVLSEYLSRDTGALVGAVPPGETLADALTAACSAHDIADVGVLVRRYRDWLGAESTSTVAAEKVVVLPHDLAVADSGFAIIDPSWTTSLRPERDVVLLRGLLDVSLELLARGARHPWSPAASAYQVAESMAAAAGIEYTAPVIADALVLDGRLRADGTEPAYDEPAGLGLLTYAELAEVAHGLGERAAQADEHIIWLLQLVQSRQRALRFTRGQVARLNTSREMWVGRRIFWLRELVRQWKRRRYEKQYPEGEWRDRSGDPIEEQPDKLEIESDLIPPGYEPGPDIEVVPPETD
ncbi:MAG TPA: hypothetical protein VFE15_04600 [Marmoricola sp.]|jgi:hypothetical protein|nr:hypothetical protein [Marmoricola sp.]